MVADLIQLLSKGEKKKSLIYSYLKQRNLNLGSGLPYLKYCKHFDGLDEISASWNHLGEAVLQGIWLMWCIRSLSVPLGSNFTPTNVVLEEKFHAW